MTVKAYDPYAGMVAARMLGEKRCLALKNKGQVSTAAVFWHDGQRYIYHPAFGSVGVPDAAFAKIVKDCMWIPVLCVPRTANLENACLPFAIVQARATGGTVRFDYHQDWNHASVIKPTRR